MLALSLYFYPSIGPHREAQVGSAKDRFEGANDACLAARPSHADNGSDSFAIETRSPSGKTGRQRAVALNVAGFWIGISVVYTGFRQLRWVVITRLAKSA